MIFLCINVDTDVQFYNERFMELDLLLYFINNRDNRSNEAILL